MQRLIISICSVKVSCITSKILFLFLPSQTHSALKTALRLVQYEKEIEAKEVYRLIALSSFLNKSYKECSRALSKLENMRSLTNDEREKYQELAVSIFTKYDPYNKKESQLKCPEKKCEAMISEL